MNRTQIYLEPDQQRTLKELARERSTTISELIRGAIQELIRPYSRSKADPLGGIVGLYCDEKDREGALRHDDVYD